MVDDEVKGTEQENAVSEEKKQGKRNKVLDKLERIAGRRKNLIAVVGTLATIIALIVTIVINMGYFSKPQDINAELVAMKPKQAEKVAENIRKNPQSSQTDKTIADAISLQQKQKFEQAIQKWRAIAKIAKGRDNNLAARALFSVGYLLQNQKKLEDAIKAYTDAIRLKADYAEAYNNRGAARNELGQYAAAIADYDKAIRLKSNYPAAYYNRGNTKNKQKQYAAAIADYNDAIRLKADYAKAYNNRGAAKNDLGQHAAAIADYDKAIRLKSNYPAAYYNRGNTKNKLKQYAAAIVDYDEAIRLNRNYAKAHYNRGEAKAKLGRKDEARKDFEKARDLAHKASNEKLAILAE